MGSVEKSAEKKEVGLVVRPQFKSAKAAVKLKGRKGHRYLTADELIQYVNRLDERTKFQVFSNYKAKK